MLFSVNTRISSPNHHFLHWKPARTYSTLSRIPGSSSLSTSPSQLLALPAFLNTSASPSSKQLLSAYFCSALRRSYITIVSPRCLTRRASNQSFGSSMISPTSCDPRVALYLTVSLLPIVLCFLVFANVNNYN